MSKVDDLNRRFLLLEQALSELYGPDKAFAAALAASLQLVQNTMNLSGTRYIQFILDDEVSRAAARDYKAIVNKQIELVLKKIHSDVCDHLGVDPAEAVQKSEAFEQVMFDILKD